MLGAQKKRHPKVACQVPEDVVGFLLQFMPDGGPLHFLAFLTPLGHRYVTAHETIIGTLHRMRHPLFGVVNVFYSRCGPAGSEQTLPPSPGLGARSRMAGASKGWTR
jgi:hypothetical protein